MLLWPLAIWHHPQTMTTVELEMFSQIGKLSLRKKLLRHPIVTRLGNNPNLKPLAEAALDHVVDQKTCTVPSWVKSSTWKQVEVAYREIIGELEAMQ